LSLEPVALFGGHLVADLLREGKQVRAVDIKPFEEWYQLFPEAENLQLDLCGKGACERAVRDISLVYSLAADMGGMGFIENNKALCMLSVLVNAHMVMMAKEAAVSRFFYSSSACVYAADKQTDPNVTALKEEDAYPAMPEDGYGWEKLRAAIFAKTSGWKRASRAITTSMGHTGRIAVAGRRRRRRFAIK
jgi:GDP-D-mannose 3', 5'-epimerase